MYVERSSIKHFFSTREG